MRIRKLTFSNINNLKGQHSVDFTSEPLDNAGLFAITGPTGSGKSTLLDVITLALFNKIPRFNKALSKNEINNSGSVVTHHTTEATATVEYDIKGQVFTSSWSISTTKSGNLKDYEMFIYDHKGQPLDLKKSEVPAHNEAIIGLNYDQFVKSILLSQGEFAQFLKANKNERGELLENITGTTIYRKLGIRTYEKWKAAKEQLEAESVAIQDIKILSEEDRTTLETEAKTLEKQQVSLDKLLQENQALHQVKTTKAAVLEKISLSKAKAASLSKDLESFIPFQKKLDVHSKLTPIQGDITSYEIAKDNAIKSKQNLEEYKVDIENAKQKLAKTINSMQTLTSQNVNVDSFKKVMSSFEQEIIGIDKDLEYIKTKGTEERQRNTKLKISYPFLSKYKDLSSTETLELLYKRTTDLEAIIAAAEITKDKDITIIKANINKQKSALEQLKEIQHNLDHCSKLEHKLNTFYTDLKQHKSTLAQTTPLIEKCTTLDASLNNNIQLLQKQKEDALKIAKLETLRTDLTAGDPCPLCGSVEHPYSKHLPEAQDNGIEQQLSDTNIKIQENKEELVQLQTKHTKTKTSIDLLTKDLNTANQELNELQTKNTALIATREDKSTYKLDFLATNIAEQSAAIAAKEQAIDSIQELKINADLKESFQNLETISQEYKTLNRKRKEKFGGEDITTITNKLQDDFEASKSVITEKTAVITKEHESLIRDQNVVAQIEKELQSKLSSLGFSSIEEVTSNILTEEHQSKITTQRDKLNHQKSSIDTELKNLKTEQEKLSAADNQPTVALEIIASIIKENNDKKETNLKRKGELTALLSRDAEDRKQIKSKQKQIEKTTRTYEKWSKLKDMIGDATGNSFSNFAQGITLKNLLVYTNNRLANLSDRYLLDMPGNDDALVIVDQYQGNTTRSVTTLSGGESFLVSLSLALSLSDMASKNTAIDSLFIDEGFGTLDQDTLESAMTTLEKLQSDSQKTVGIISHVEALKERINVQIQLNKNAQGYSAIELIG